MLIRKPSPVIGIVVGASFAAYHSGQSLHYATPSPIQVIGIATSSTASVMAMFNPTTFATVDEPFTIVLPNRKFEQS
jgi:hypothetical protein